MTYNNRIIDYFNHNNYIGTLANANARAFIHKAGNIIEFTAKIANGTIQQFNYRIKGPTVLVACCAYIAENVQNKLISDAEKITHQQLTEFFDVPQKYISSVFFAEDALQQLLENYNA